MIIVTSLPPLRRHSSVAVSMTDAWRRGDSSEVAAGCHSVEELRVASVVTA